MKTMKRIWNSFKIAFAMYSKIPMPRADWEKENMRYMMCFFPFVGIVIGARIAGWSVWSEKIGVGDTLRSAVYVVLPVLVMIGIGYFCNRKQIFDMNGLKGLKALLGDIMLPVMLFNAFFTAVYSVRVIVVFLVVFLGYVVAIALGYVLRPAVKPYGKYLPFLLASAEGGMLGYALYGLIVGNQTGFAAVDLGQTV